MAEATTDMIIHCLIADDEPIARIGMQRLVQQVPFLHLAGMAKNTAEVNELLTRHPVQLLFLDIQMPGVNGVEYIKSLDQPPRVIFTTAYPDYAVTGYELDALDYLLKPITLPRFLKAVNKARDYFTRSQQPAVTAQPAGPSGFLYVKTNRQWQKILFEEVLFVEAMLNYVVIYTTTQKVITYASMKSMQEQLPAPLFLKVHKSYIISTAHIKLVQGYEVMIGNHRLPVSRRHRASLLQLMGK